MTGDSMNYIESLVTNQEYIGVRNTIIMKYIDHIYDLFQKETTGTIELASKCKFQSNSCLFVLVWSDAYSQFFHVMCPIWSTIPLQYLLLIKCPPLGWGVGGGGVGGGGGGWGAWGLSVDN